MGNKQSTPAPAASAFSAGQRSASFRTFLDSYSNIEDVQADLRRSGLESCNLILGIGKLGVARDLRTLRAAKNAVYSALSPLICPVRCLLLLVECGKIC